jgi:hypothetical protein
MSLAKLKSASNMEKLNEAIKTLNSGSNFKNNEENFYKVECDKAGNGFAVIRFLPAPEVDGDGGLPWVKLFNHGFQGPGGWYIENSLTTLGQEDPVSEYNTVLWNSGIEANKDIARKQKRRLNYICNILVVEDPKNPENEGQVKLFKFGKKIFDKITEAMNPQFEDEKPINPFDMWKGANFKLKIRKVEGYSNYDKSEFENPSPVASSDDKIEEIWKKEYSLQEFLAPKNFKSYTELKTKLNRVLGVQAPIAPIESADSSPKASPKTSRKVTEIVDDDDDNLDYFKELADAED